MPWSRDFINNLGYKKKDISQLFTFEFWISTKREWSLKNDAKSNELKTLNQRFTRLAVERDQYKDKFIWLKQVQDSCFDIVKSFLQHSDGVPSVKIVGELYELYKETSKKLAVTGVTPINSSKKAAVRNTKDDRSSKVK